VYGECALSGIALHIERVERQHSLCRENVLLYVGLSDISGRFTEDALKPRCTISCIKKILSQKKTKPANAGLSGFFLSGNKVISTRYNIAISEISYQLPLPKSNNYFSAR